MPESLATIVIPNYNGMRFLPRLMASLAAQTRRDFNVCVVDDGSSDGSVAYLREHCPAVRVLVNERNLGFAGTCNAGIRSSSTPIVALLNNDTHCDPAWFEQAVRPFDEPTVGAVASLVVLADPPHRIDTAGDVYSVAGGALKRLHGQPIERARDVPIETFSPCGASAFYRRAALAQVGLLDESFVSYYEDVELGFRLQWAGWRCVLARESICYHHLNSSYSPGGWTMRFNSSRNAEIVWWAHMPPPLRWKYLPAHVLFLLLQGAAETFRGRMRSWVAGKWAAWQARDLIRAKRAADRGFAQIRELDMEARLETDWWGLIVQPQLRKLSWRWWMDRRRS